MGMLIWIATGFVVGIGSRLVAARLTAGAWRPATSLSAIGGLLGGFLFDLARHGDSVMHFQGPTVAGAVLGAFVLVALSGAW